jgi:glutathione S-transferase
MTATATPDRPTLVIGNKNYSSWSLRPWLAMKQAGIAFDEIRIPLYGEGSAQRLLRYSPSGKVPVLIDRGLTIWDSLSICEYLAESHPDLWPAEAPARAVARSACAEMHSGFVRLRNHMTMNIRKNYAGKGVGPGVADDIARVFAVWQDCRTRFGAGGPFLFGRFTIADAMYAPVVTRFATYGVASSANLKPYLETMLALPPLQEWIAAAKAETESIPDGDIYG